LLGAGWAQRAAAVGGGDPEWSRGSGGRPRRRVMQGDGGSVHACTGRVKGRGARGGGFARGRRGRGRGAARCGRRARGGRSGQGSRHPHAPKGRRAPAVKGEPKVASGATDGPRPRQAGPTGPARRGHQAGRGGTGERGAPAGRARRVRDGSRGRRPAARIGIPRRKSRAWMPGTPRWGDGTVRVRGWSGLKRRPAEGREAANWRAEAGRLN